MADASSNLAVRSNNGAAMQRPAANPFAPTNIAESFRVAEHLSKSAIVPQGYKNDVGACFVALEMANRIGLSFMQVIQNLHVIQGKPTWSAQFLIAMVNASGRYSELQWETRGKEGADDYGYRAYATRLSTGKVIHGPWVDWAMVKAEGWSGRNGSKWRSMPSLMFQYRAAAFFVRMNCPDIALGLYTQEEIVDSTAETVRESVSAIPQAIAASTPVESAPAEQDPQAALQESAPVATLPTHTSKNYKEAPGVAFTELTADQLTAYASRCLGSLQGKLQASHRKAFELQLAAAEAEVNRRMESESEAAEQALGNDAASDDAADDAADALE